MKLSGRKFKTRIMKLSYDSQCKNGTHCHWMLDMPKVRWGLEKWWDSSTEGNYHKGC